MFLRLLSCPYSIDMLSVQSEHGFQSDVYTAESHKGKRQQSGSHQHHCHALHSLRHRHERELFAQSGKDYQRQSKSQSRRNRIDYTFNQRYSTGDTFFNTISTICTRAAMTNTKVMVCRYCNDSGSSTYFCTRKVTVVEMVSTKATAIPIPNAVSIFFDTPRNGQMPRNWERTILLTNIAETNIRRYSILLIYDITLLLNFYFAALLTLHRQKERTAKRSTPPCAPYL